MNSRPHAVLLYHYFHPDDVVSARLFSDLAVGLTERGWDVTAAPCNRGCRDEAVIRPLAEEWGGGRIRRVWRPLFRQASAGGRLLNAAWMLAAWARAAVTLPRHRREVVVVGTDPVFGVLAAIPWRALRRRSGIVHWCHDLHPDASVADGTFGEASLPVRALRRLLGAAYRRCDVLADLGPCMRDRLRRSGSPARTVTLTPWALVEPPRPVGPDPATRRALFGDAALGLLYSGNFGRAHSYREFLDLARALRGCSARVCFAARGNRVGELRAAVTADDVNVSFAGFAPEGELEKRLGACDLHLVSLRTEWAGTVVPSKFFGALATGRGVVYAGPPESAVGRWVAEHGIGWVLTPETLGSVVAGLRELAARPDRLADLRTRCHAVYHEHFSKARQIERWDAVLRDLLASGCR